MIKELGNVLRSRREELGVTLEDMEKQTKIRQRYLIALEEGDWAPLPGYVYARGFVRSYAEQLGLDGRALLKQYVDEVDEQESAHDSKSSRKDARTVDEAPRPKDPNGEKARDTKPNSAAVAQRYKSRQRQARPVEPISASQFSHSSRQHNRRRTSRGGSRGWVGQTIAIIAILAVISVGLYYADHKNHPHVPYAGAGANANVPNPTVATNTNGKPKAGSYKKPSASKPKAVSNPNQGATTLSSVTVTAVPIQGNVLKYLVQTKQPLSVVLSAPITRLWTEVTADGKMIDEETLPQGDIKRYTAKQTISFIIGNPPAAEFAVDGKAIVLPNPGKTVTVTFVKVPG